jgi:hypothetical protein
MHLAEMKSVFESADGSGAQGGNSKKNAGEGGKSLPIPGILMEDEIVDSSPRFPSLLDPIIIFSLQNSLKASTLFS